MTLSYNKAVLDIIKAGNNLDKLNLAPATSGNYSIRLGNNEMAITVSGAHKGYLTSDDIMRTDLEGNPLKDKKPSAETLLHCQIYKLYPDINAVLHTHSVPCTVLTRLMPNDEAIILSGYEMLKAFPNVTTHDTNVCLPIFENTQDMVSLSNDVDLCLNKHRRTPAYLIRGHGLYAWGCDMKEAQRVTEASETLLSCELQAMQVKK